MAAAILVLAAACSTNPQTGNLQPMLVGEETEIRVGRAAAPQIEKRFGGRFLDDRMQEYIQEVGGRLSQVSRRPNMPYRFAVLDSQVPNAFSLPDGSVYITRGMLGMFQNEDQLAAVLGHEVAHVAGRHAMSRYSEAMLMHLGVQVGAIGAMATGSPRDRESALGAAAAAGYMLSLVNLAHRREDEMQADEYGARYAYEAGYNPNAMTEVLDLLRRMDRDMPHSTVPPWLRSHPAEEVRISAMREMLARDYGPEALAQQNRAPDRWVARMEDFLRARPALAKYDEAMDKYDEGDFLAARSLLDEAIQEAPAVVEPYLARGWARIRLGDAPGALADFTEAYRRCPTSSEARFGIGRMLVEDGRFDEGIEHLNAVADDDPADYRPPFYLGKAYLGQSRYDDAEEQFELALELMDKLEAHPEPYFRQSRELLAYLRNRPH